MVNSEGLSLIAEAGDFVAFYLDVVIVFSQSLGTPLEHLKKVFNCLRDTNLKLNPKKCKFMCEEVEYLDHVVTTQGHLVI